MSYVDDYLAQVMPVWERIVNWLYLDTKGNVTTAGGVMLPNVAACLKLPWCDATWHPVDQDAIIREWQRVKALPVGMVADHYKSVDGLFLQNGAVQAICRERVVETAALLRVHFAIDSYPKPAQLALTDMGYNLGVPRLVMEYPHLCAAAVAEDWPLASRECLRNKDDHGFANRNQWTVNQFALAGQENMRG